MGLHKQSFMNLMNFLCNSEGRRGFSLPVILVMVICVIIVISTFHQESQTSDQLLDRAQRIVFSTSDHKRDTQGNLHSIENLHTDLHVGDTSTGDTNIFLKNGTMGEIFRQVYEVYRKTCYWLDEKSKQWGLRKPIGLERRDCEQTLPQVIVIGAKKCGTTALTLWLSTHPLIAAVTAEKHYFDENPNRSLEWYRRKMPYSTKVQITMETTPKYFVYPENAPERIYNEISPKTKIILILCDPVGRAISDYVHEAELNKTTGFYRIEDTFAASVLRKDGTVDESNELVDTGVYVKHAKRWLKYFPEIFVVDGTSFKQSNPVSTLIRAEKFLGLPRFFEGWQFYMDSNKGKYCSKISFPMHCLGSNKGRKHPEIETGVLEKVRDFYRPFNQQVAELLNQTFVWV